MDTRLKTMEREFNEHLQGVVNSLHEAYAQRIAQSTAREVEMEIEIKRLRQTVDALQATLKSKEEEEPKAKAVAQ